MIGVSTEYVLLHFPKYAQENRRMANRYTEIPQRELFDKLAFVLLLQCQYFAALT